MSSPYPELPLGASYPGAPTGASGAPPGHPSSPPGYPPSPPGYPPSPPGYPPSPPGYPSSPPGYPSSPPGYPSSPPGYASARPRISPWLWVVLGVVLLGLGTCGGVVGLAVLGSQMEPGGVMVGSAIPAAKRAALVERGLCGESERLIAFYDGSLSLDLSEVALVTTDRVVFAKDAEVSAIPLASVVSIDHRVEGIIGDVIVVAADDGDRIRIEVAHLNDGVTFLDALEDEARKSRPDVIVRRAQPR
ncbi:MAG: hypothetical protein KF894_06885 [Labilithrix sp.]|nr:hypothetical protein [Labilithrix sp.]